MLCIFEAHSPHKCFHKSVLSLLTEADAVQSQSEKSFKEITYVLILGNHHQPDFSGTKEQKY